MSLQAHTVLDSVAMVYTPLWNRDRALAGVRLGVRATTPRGVDAPHLLQAIGEDWPEGAPPLVLSLQTPRLLQQALSCPPVRNTWLEVPTVMFDAAETRARLSLAQRRGHQLLRHGDFAQLHGRSVPDMDLRNALRLSAQDRWQGLDGQLVEGLSRRDEVVRALDEGRAWAVTGWPEADVLQAHRGRPLGFDRRVVHQVLDVLDDEECSIEYLERLVRQDPVLVYRLLLLVNSAAYGLRREIGSLRHALMMLGFRELGRWLAEHLPVPDAEGDEASDDDPELHPVRYAMVMRARLSQHLLASGSDDMLRAEVYTTAILARLDVLLQAPLGELLHRLPLSGRVFDALLRNDGPYHPLIDLARAMGDPTRIDQLASLCERHEIPQEEANRALLRMLATSRDHSARRSERMG